MAKKKKRKRTISKNATAYFDPHYDDDLKSKHPILYWLTVIAIIVLVSVGPSIYIAFASHIQSTCNHFLEFIAILVGFISSFGIGIGICNLFMILHKQYLGHKVTLISFAIGIGGSALSLLLIWLL